MGMVLHKSIITIITHIDHVTPVSFVSFCYIFGILFPRITFSFQSTSPWLSLALISLFEDSLIDLFRCTSLTLIQRSTIKGAQ